MIKVRIRKRERKKKVQEKKRTHLLTCVIKDINSSSNNCLLNIT